MTRLPLFLTLTLFTASLPASTAAWEIASAVTSPCHEWAVVHGVERVPALLDRPVPLPEDSRIWHDVYNALDIAVAIGGRSEQERFARLSLVLGTRFQDIGGHSVFDERSFRELHGGAAHQYEHCLRKPRDDWDSGNEGALSGTLDFINTELDTALMILKKDSAGQLDTTIYTIDFVGPVKVPIWAPAFHLGYAAHAVADCFSHTVRSNDLTRILHVMNVVDAGSYNYDPARDGLAHSNDLDECDDEGQEVYEHGARPATIDFFSAFASSADGRPEALDAFFAHWMTYEGGCGPKTNFCASKWNALVRSDPLGPPINCGASPPSARASNGLLALLLTALR